MLAQPSCPQEVRHMCSQSPTPGSHCPPRLQRSVALQPGPSVEGRQPGGARDDHSIHRFGGRTGHCTTESYRIQQKHIRHDTARFLAPLQALTMLYARGLQDGSCGCSRGVLLETVPHRFAPSMNYSTASHSFYGCDAMPTG